MMRADEMLHFPYFLGRAIAITRIMTGVVFFAHGYRKVFVDGIGGFSAYLGQIGVPLPGFLGPLVAVVELVGGMALILGLFSRWVSIPLALDMLVAMIVVHLRNGFFLPNGYEYSLLLFGICASLVLAGSGEWALDNMIRRITSEHRGPSTKPAAA